MNNIWKRNKLTLLGIVIGTIGGYLYWQFVGCEGGTCPITSSPLYSSLWGAAMGGLIFSIFQKKEPQNK